MGNGWISLHRSLLDWEWYTDANTMRLFIHLLLIANHSDKKYKSKIIKRGELITGREKLSAEIGLSVQAIRTSLKRLKSTNEITIESTSKGTLINIVNYSHFQGETRDSNQLNNQQANQPTTNQQPASNQQVTTNNNVNNNNNVNKGISKAKINILDSYDLPPEIKETINTWFQYKKEKGQTYKPTGAKTIINKIIDNEKEYGLEAVRKIIDNSISNNYSGLFFEKIGQQPNNNYNTGGNNVIKPTEKFKGLFPSN